MLEEDKKQYSKIDKKQRQEIIQKIVFEKKAIQEIALEYKLLPSTCKSIVNTFMKEGRVGKKENRIRKIKKITITYNLILNPLNPYLSSVQMQKQIVNVEEQSQKSRKGTEELPQQQAINFQEYLKQWSQDLFKNVYY